MKRATKQKNTEVELKGKSLKGIVTSDKMTDTIVVTVSSFSKHPKYGKYIQSRKKYKAHDAGNTAKIGETVIINETRPISKDKRFKLVSIEK